MHDKNNEIHGMELRKLSMVIFLNDRGNQKEGNLRLYTKGLSKDGIVGISPRLGRAVLFKSEEMLHQVMHSQIYDNYAFTVHFTQIVDKPSKLHHPIPEDWSIFVSIASYRDLQLVHTLRSLVNEAAYPERLRIVVYNQYDFWNQWDQKLELDLKRYIVEATKLPKPPTIVMENIWHENAKNVYHARYMIQRHY